MFQDISSIKFDIILEF